ncbi:hypothetical protein GGR54DRAFT_640734 [Hypoxylon sp. NC1633]|nr:hypothetical protein GGR54DRAFT_640734 [Hypoxylon sp. NC1633]
MAEPENFEDDLFADLYDDNEASAAPAPAVAAPQASAPAPPIPQPTVEAPPQAEIEHAPSDVMPTTEENGYDEYQDENYDDDDDVDFNLGNDLSTAAVANPSQDDTTPSYHPVRGPASKEDG